MLCPLTISEMKPEKKASPAPVSFTMLFTLITSLDEAERTIAKEAVGQDKVRGSVDKAMFEDDI